jgi:mannitol/fructose-specific phosphotransferase system IIA component (Ntr-type)
MNISDVLRLENISSELKGTTKEEVINELIDLLKNDDRVINLEDVRKAVFEREKLMSTGIGKGFALPHGKTNSIKEIVAAFGKTINPVDFQASDDEPARLIFLLVGKDNLVGPHIKLLSRISRIMIREEAREKLLLANTPEEIYKCILEEEKNFLENS